MPPAQMPLARLLRRLVLLPLLAPLLAVVLVGALNPRPWVGLRLLIWRTPEWTIGSWLVLAATSGGALSATATALALQAGSAGSRRQRHRSIPDGRSRGGWPWGQGEGPGGGAAETWVDGPSPEPPAAWGPDRREPAEASWPGQAWAGPSRDPGEPPPTLSVPFRVIRRGTAAGAADNAAPDRRQSAGASRSPGPAGPAQGSPADARDGTPAPGRGFWPLNRRPQAQPGPAATDPGPLDPAAVDRSWMQEPDGEW